jgi:hypothetical protein
MDQNQLRALSRPFSDVRTRPGRNGGQISYVEAHAVVQRLNEALGGDWSFRVLEHEILDGEVIVLAELRMGDLVKQAFGGSDITKTRDGKLVSLADDMKSAATDALKKAATLLGVGLQPGVEEPALPSAPRLVPAVADHEEPEVLEGNRLTRKQADFIARIARERGMARGEVDAMARERYGKASAFLTVKEASEFIQQLNHAA